METMCQINTVWNYLKIATELKMHFANWFAVLQKAFETRGFEQCVDIEPCVFNRKDCIIITCADDC